MNSIGSFFKHQLTAKSKKGFGIHSPFLFHLVSEVINDFTPYYCYESIEKQRNKLNTNQQTIEISDLGAGSKSIKGNQRKISQIAKTSLKPKKQAQLLFRIANHFNPDTILELGTSLGITASYLAKVSSKSKVVSIEGCPNIAKYAKATFKALEIENIDLKIGDINKHLLASLHELKSVDFVFFDGNHTKAATLEYFEQCLPFKNKDSVFVFDDINLSSEMQEAWSNIKNHEQVSASLDLFHLGIVFFKAGLTKEHLKVRF